MGEFEGPDFVGVIEYRYGKSPDPIHSHFFYGIIYDSGHIAESPEIGTLAEIAKGLYGWDFRERLNFKPRMGVDKQREGLAEIIVSSPVLG